MLIIDALTDWIKNGMVDAVESQYQSIFDSVNSQVSDVSSQVGQTPQGWNGNVFSMIKTLSESVVVPIAGMILTFGLSVCVFSAYGFPIIADFCRDDEVTISVKVKSFSRFAKIVILLTRFRKIVKSLTRLPLKQ